ncbi:hypothetical protein EDB87DRAFT_1090459 [Lactarius vividus]|nr:hypothetical protein EDB87DRAFT_1090459 [Lactarius vividus]
MFSHARPAAATCLSHQRYPLSPNNPSPIGQPLEPGARIYRSAVPLASGSVDTLLYGGVPSVGVVSVRPGSTEYRTLLSPAYAVCFYDWIISLDQEATFIYPAPWNVVKAAYLFCRYYPLVLAPFQFWGLFADHEQRVCESYYRVLFASNVPTILSAQFILMLRTYAFSGRKKIVLAVLSITILGLFSVIIWVIYEHITLSLLFVVVKHTSCFPISDQPNFVLVQGAGAAQGASLVHTPFAYYYHLGIISILTALFDGLNIFIVFRHCIRERGTFGPIGQSFLKQGVLVYFITTSLNMLTIGTIFR